MSARIPRGVKAVRGARLLAMGNPALGNEAQNRPAAVLMCDAFAPLPAALALRKTPGHDNPFYWAPFVVVGTDESVAPAHP